MTRVTENSALNSVNYSINKTKQKIEDLQLKGSNLKRVSRPSDDPVGNVNLLEIRSQNIDAGQYMRNLNYSQTNLHFTETILEELTDLLVKAKELAIGQSSDIYNPEIRESVSKEIHQIRAQAISLANKRIGNRYLFAGQKVLTKPFNEQGEYLGDKNKIFIEINKDVFIPINLTGSEVFFEKPSNAPHIPEEIPGLDPKPSRNLASVDGQSLENPGSLFQELQSLENALLTNNPDIVQSLLEKMDKSIERVVAYRTKLGSITNSLANAESNIEKTKLINEEYKTKIEDADVTELFSNLQKEQNVLQASYKTSATMMNTSLLDFLR